MPQNVEVDFRGAPPAQGGGRGDFIAPGYYRMVVSRMINGLTKKEPIRTMYTTWLTVEGGEYDGRSRPEYFVMPLPEDREEKKMMGLNRFHAFINACGWMPGEKKVKFDLDNLVNRRIMVLVGEQDEKDMQGNKTGKMEPKFSAFDPMPKAEGATAAAAPAAPATTAPAVNGNGTAKAVAATTAAAPVAAATAVAEPVADDEDEDDAIAMDEPAAEIEPTPVAAPPAAKATRAPRAAATPAAAEPVAEPASEPVGESGDDGDDEVEDLFN